jgi:hypothetical protein
MKIEYFKSVHLNYFMRTISLYKDINKDILITLKNFFVFTKRKY